MRTCFIERRYSQNEHVRAQIPVRRVALRVSKQQCDAAEKMGWGRFSMSGMRLLIHHQKHVP